MSCVSILQGDNLVKEYTSKKRELEKAISDLQKDVDNCNKKINQAYNDAEQNVNSILQIANTQLANAQKALTDSQTAVADSKTKLTASEGALVKAEEALVKAEEKLNNIEHDMLTHVLTLMGVFSAVITIFMSLVITSTAWLNNADGASAVLAFVVPSAVAVVAVASLLLIIFVYHNATTGSDNHPIKVSPAYIVLIVFFAILAGSLVHISTSYSQKCTPDHIHTILTESDYRIGVEPKPDGSIVNVYLQFTLDGKNYWFDYNEEYIHNGNLYFCQEHKRLE